MSLSGPEALRSLEEALRGNPEARLAQQRIIAARAGLEQASASKRILRIELHQTRIEFARLRHIALAQCNSGAAQQCIPVIRKLFQNPLIGY